MKVVYFMPENRTQNHILHIITNLPFGGAQDNTLLTVEKLNREKYDVSLMCSPDGDWLPRAQQIPNLNLVFVDELKREISPINDFIAFWKILRLLNRGKYTIVHTHTTKASLLGRIAAKLAGIPVIVHTVHAIHFHDYVNPLIRWLYIMIERFLSKITDKIITVSKMNLKKALDLKLAEAEKFVNIYSGIELEKFNTNIDVDSKKKELGIFNGEKIVGMVGRLSKQKAPLDFIKAIPEVLTFESNVLFVIVGEGLLKKSIIELAKKIGIESKLKLLGFREDIQEILPTFDVFVLTSLWEGLGRSLTEAMYTGLPVVATNVDGVPELVKDGETGILVNPKDVASIAQGIITFLSDKQKAKKIGEAAKQEITDSFDATHMVHQLEKIYDDLLLRQE